MKNLFSRTVLLGNMQQLSVEEIGNGGISIREKTVHSIGSNKGDVIELCLNWKAAEALGKIMEEWIFEQKKEEEEKEWKKIHEMENEPLPDKEQEKIIWETVRLQKELGVTKQRLEKNLEGLKVGKNQVAECAELIRKENKHINELEDKLNCLAGR